MQKTKSFLRQSYLRLINKYIEHTPKIYPLNERMQGMILSISCLLTPASQPEIE